MDWLAHELMTGFQKLLCLGLERQPAAEVLPGTVATWIEALQHLLAWDQVRDAPRIRKAFVTMAATRRTWPQPRDLIECLPEPDQVRLTKHSGIPATKEEREANLERLRQLYGDAVKG